ncbi:peptidoglycan-binding protein [Acidaminococcus intestini]|nr:peptidoglycan-binding protein [Acidaminococcus intestini]
MRVRKLGFLLALLLLLTAPLSRVQAAKLVAQYGAKGRRVEEVQSMLHELKLYRGEIDGEFGKGTKEAVLSFQKKQGKQLTGSVDWPLYNLMSKKAAFLLVGTVRSGPWKPRPTALRIPV